MIKWIVRGTAAGLAGLLLLDAIGARLGLVTGPALELPDQSAWLVSRAAGITAQLALWLDVVLGLSVSSGTLDRFIPRSRSLELHRFFSFATLSLVALHALALLADRFVRFDSLDVVLPFFSPHRRFATGLGVLAAWGVVVLHFSFELRKRIGARAWRLIHHASFTVYVLATLHGAFAGTDMRSGWLPIAHWASFGVVLALVALRLVALPRSRAGARRP